MATYFKIQFDGEPTDADYERVSYLIKRGFTEGQLLEDNGDDDEETS